MERLYEIQLFRKLLQFPLFQGMSQDDLTKIVGYVKFDFIKVERGKAVMHENDICDHLYFMLNGILEVRTPASDHGYTFVEHIHAPYTIQPERIFGLIQHYSHDFMAEETCGFVRIDKEEILKLSDNYFIFKLNLLNLLSREVMRKGTVEKRPQELRGAHRPLHWTKVYPSSRQERDLH